jgi:predicted negative regulator of RcsB-dependent stress response
VDEYLTDDERADSAKRWLRENGLFLAAGVVLGLGVLFGWQQWEDYRMVKSVEASVVWQQLNSAASGQRFNEVDESLAILEKEYASTPYLDQARLSVARMHMDRNSPDDAVVQLSNVVAGSGDAALRRVAELRMAQIYLYQEKYDEALSMLGAEDPSAFVALFHELRGDVFFAQGLFEDAREEYELALEKDEFRTIDRSLVQMKLDDVSGSIAVLVVESEAPLSDAD